MARPCPRGVALALLAGVLAGCGTLQRQPGLYSPTAAGYKTNDLVDPAGQAEGDRQTNLPLPNSPPTAASAGARRSVLALSGGGAYGAYSAGVICGWTEAGTRPTFDVVTGISTGSLIAPLAFLGPKYDGELRRFYTTLGSDRIYQLQLLGGLFGESIASNAPLARVIDETLTPEIVAEVAVEHRKGRRLYVGTTERDSRRFVIWDVGAIACRCRPDDRELIKSILLGSAAIPGFFPASKIPVTVDGEPFVERHVDGSLSTTVFFRPPAGAEDDPSILARTDLYVVVAGKLYADPAVVEPRTVRVAVATVQAAAFTQTRGDLIRLCQVAARTGMGYHLASIPAGFDGPNASTDFDPAAMGRLFDEGVRQVKAGTVWRRTPPGGEPGETPLQRADTDLRHLPRTCPP